MDLASSALLRNFKRIRHSIASSGLRRTLADIAVRYIAYSPEQDRSFDEPFGTDTAGSVQPSELGITDEARKSQAILYLPSPPRVTRWMLENVGIEHSQFTMVDLGCGKGRVLLVASEFEFRAIHGVDISAELCGIARRNVAAYQPLTRKCQDVQVHHADATLFEFPAGDLLVHLYHPFDPQLTAGILQRLGEAVQQAPRRVIVAYLVYTGAVEQVEAALATVPWLKRRRYELSVTGQYDWLFFSN